MFRSLRARARRVTYGRLQVDFAGLELDISAKDLLADLASPDDQSQFAQPIKGGWVQRP